MFFSQELLARRDSGFGLLWLAATLGSKSTFKKLPKRSVLSADISELCELIAQPEEPLALRLSSNLMIGVARVYKVKQELFLTDVTNCVTSLKKVVQDLQTTAAKERALQMAQPTVRLSALTLSTGPDSVFFTDFDAMVDNWDKHLNIHEAQDAVDEDADDQDFNPRSQKNKNKRKPNSNRDSQQAEDVRADACTLKEHHDHLMSASFDLSFQGNPEGGGIDPSSSQIDPAFPLDDNFFQMSDGLGLGLDDGLADELARELGDGWGASLVEELPRDMNVDVDMNPPQLPSDDFAMGGAAGADEFLLHDDPFPDQLGSPAPLVPRTPIKTTSRNRKENATPRLQSRLATPRASVAPPSPANSFSRQFLSQDEEFQEPAPAPFTDITSQLVNDNKEKENRPPTKKNKRTRLLLDARTELTDEELKIARAKYLEEQRNQRRELDNKKIEKDSGRVVEELIWGVPAGIEAPALIDLWQENFKVQVEARTGAFHIHLDGAEARQPPKKRRKLQTIEEAPEEVNEPPPIENDLQNDFIDGGFGGDLGYYQDEPNLADIDIDIDPSRLRSSEEPGQARNISISRPPSVGPEFSFDLGSNEKLGSQRSSLFPWDNAGADISSSVGGAGGGSDRVVFERAEVRLRGSSVSRREGSLPLSQNGSISGIRGISPGDFGRSSQIIGEDFTLRDEVEEPANHQNSDTQRSDLNLVTLERNSFNFLEYVKMQQKAMRGGPDGISFDTIVPKTASTRHVAAAAFYHCLVLATKDLVHVSQAEPYGPISVNTNMNASL
ncbi:R8 protein [Marasmius crinis-equi]|uniref:R8 protein n=1 Tax=Marasmius crinis-equi TaxID=585013 RepID=A0ABR3G1A3_9AGAR